MTTLQHSFARTILVVTVFVLSALGVQAQSQAVAPRITRAIDDENLTTLKNTTHALARSEFDGGAVSDDLPMERLQLVLKRSPQQEAALKTLIDQQHDKTSSNYHKWLTPEQFGKQFGPAAQDIQAVTGWLGVHGFEVKNVSKGGTVIEFSGTAGLIRNAFHTEIHNYTVNGEAHIANNSNQQIPAALAPVVAGVASLHNFFPKPHLINTGKRVTLPEANGKPVPHLTFGAGDYALGPADFAVIYNVDPVYNAGITGTGRTIATLGVSDIDASDVSDFDTVFGLPGGNWSVIHNGTDPGITSSGDQTESSLDNEWAGAIGYGATIKFVVSETTAATFGTDLSAEYVVDNDLADIMTVSYGACELQEPSSYINLESNIGEQAAAEGITYTVADGDAGAEDCSNPATQTVASGPVSADLPADTPYTIAVGGTMFNEGGDDNLYWSTSTTAYPSALSYIPEDVWNESCTGTATGCPSIYAGGGGISESFALPSWQDGFNIPAAPNGFSGRGTPDVSLSAAGHDGYAVCLNASCVANSQGEIELYIVGGTSAASPSFASIMSLVDQETNSRQGQADYTLYKLAAKETFSSCNGSGTPALSASSGCVFNDTTVGNNIVPGETSTTEWDAEVGWDAATGFGSVNADELATKWNTVSFNSTITTLTGVPSTIAVNTSIPVQISVSSGAGTPAGPVSVLATQTSGPNVGFPYVTLSSGSASTSISFTAGGTYSVVASYAGNGDFGSSQSTVASIVVTGGTSNQGSFTVAAAAASPASVSPGGSATSTITVTGTGGFGGSVSLSCVVSATKTGDTDIPTCGVTGTNPVALTSTTTSATSTVTVSTTAASVVGTGGRTRQNPIGGGWLAGAGALMLAWLVFYAAPERRRWSTLAAAVVFVGLVGLAACGGGGSSGGGGGGGSTGTSADTYTVTVTAASGSTTQTSTFTVTVN